MVDNAVEKNLKIKESESDEKSQKQIETAVKFLQNPRVRETPLSQRKAFLVKKGLTEDEIQKAIELVQASDVGPDLVPRNVVHGQAVFPGQPPPASLRLRDFFWVALLGGSLGYLLAHLVKTYLLPYILNQKDDSDDKINQLQTSVSELKENLSQTVNGIQDTLDSVQRMLQDQQQKVQSLSLNLSTSQACQSQSMTESYSLTEIKSELSSLKGLLLNRRQFPSPVVQSSPLPSIPSWQRNDIQLNIDEDTKNGDGLQSRTLETKPETNSDSVRCNGNDADTSSGTLELRSSDATDNDPDIFTTQSAAGSKITQSDQNESSYSSMSSDVGSPNLSLQDITGLKPSISESYVKLSN